MQLPIILRGPWRDVSRMIQELTSKYYPFYDEKGDQIGTANVEFRPYILGEFVFPKEQLPVMLKSLDGGVYHAWEKKYAFMLRKLLKLKKLPDPKTYESAVKLAFYDRNVEKIPLGIKEDVIRDGYEQL